VGFFSSFMVSAFLPPKQRRIIDRFWSLYWHSIYTIYFILSFFLLFAAFSDRSVEITYPTPKQCAFNAQITCHDIEQLNVTTGAIDRFVLDDLTLEPSSLAWSPDGLHLGFLSAHHGEGFDLFVFDADMQAITTFSIGDEVGFFVWLDETTILATQRTSARPAYHDLYRLQLEDGTQTLLLQTGDILSPLRLSRGGRTVAFRTSDGIMFIDTTSSEIVGLADGADFAWSRSDADTAFLLSEGNDLRTEISTLTLPTMTVNRLADIDTALLRLELLEDDTGMAGIRYLQGVSEFIAVQFDTSIPLAPLSVVPIASIRDHFTGSSLSPLGDLLAYIAYADQQELSICIVDIALDAQTCYPDTMPDLNGVPAWRPRL
jgi:hypothetical protein